MCNFLNLFGRVKAEPFFGLFWLSERKIVYCISECMCSVRARWPAVSSRCGCGRGDRSYALCHPLLAATAPQQNQQQGTCSRPLAQSGVPQLAVVDSCSKARPSAWPGHRQLILPVASRRDGSFCLRAERVPEEGSVSKRSWTRTPSVAAPASASAVLWRAPALGCAGAGLCWAVQRAGKQCMFSPR